MNTALLSCKQEHLDILLQISRETFVNAFSHLNDPEDFQTYLDTAFSRETLTKELANENMFYYLVYLKDELAGYFKLNRGDAQTEVLGEDSVEIERIYVLEQFQGQRLGHWMIEAIKELAGQMGFSYVWLGVWEENRDAIRFYQNNGFKKFGEHPYYIGKDKQTDWLMRCDIPTL